MVYSILGLIYMNKSYKEFKDETNKSFKEFKDSIEKWVKELKDDSNKNSVFVLAGLGLLLSMQPDLRNYISTLSSLIKLR